MRWLVVVGYIALDLVILLETLKTVIMRRGAR